VRVAARHTPDFAGMTAATRGLMRRCLLALYLLSPVAGCSSKSEAMADPDPMITLAPLPDVTSTPFGPPIIAQLTSAPNVPSPIYRHHPAHVIVNLTVNEVVKEISPGVRYTFWTFGGDVPGKFIRVRQGDVVEVHLKNDPSSKMPHNIDLHAVSGPGGGAASTFTAPGHESQFTFRATNPGLFVYHCATAPVPMHVANGMYGLILVEPPGGLPPAFREYYVMQGELYTSGKYHAPGLQAFDMDKGIDERPTYVVFNGAEGSLTAGKALVADTGNHVRIYFGNGGPNLASNFHVIGEIFDKVYPEAGSHPQENVQTTLVPAGGATIVDFTVDVPGTYALVDHALFRAFNKGAVGQLVVTGPTRHELYSDKQADRAYTGDDVAFAAPPPPPAAPTTDADRFRLGEATFGKICAACHQPTGQGLPPTFPPLAKSDYLAAAPRAQVIGHILHGLQGPVTVLGTTYNNAMPPMAFLSDDEIAGVLSYVRGSWGNELGNVAPGEVAAVRNQTSSR
jgi:nitrite reductase (NO-forming)